METYKHTVQYYETDKMGITHHSNYVRWMEEARIDFLKQIGWAYDRLESMGIASPVVAIDCNYKHPTVFAEVIDIKVTIKEFKGIKLVIGYEMKNADDKIVCLATSSHCFLDEKGIPIALKKRFPEFNDALIALVEG